MKAIYLNVILLLLSISAFGQTVKELEYDLSWHRSSEKYEDKINIAKKLQELDPFNYQATEYICRYYDDRKIDSVSVYFDNLIEKYPNNTEPYLLRTELLWSEYDFRQRDIYNSQKIKYLNRALQINDSDLSVIFKLAETYYKDFIYPLEKEKDWMFGFESDDAFVDTTFAKKEKEIKLSTFEHPADSALKYFYRLWNLNTSEKDIIYYPIRQVECYLNILENSEVPKNADDNFNQCFFPSWYFANLSEDWQCDNTVDYLFEIESGKRTAEWLEIQLTDLKEDCLFNKELKEDKTIYRFTWLRSFHNPIAIRIENVNNETMLYWKVGKGAGGYEPKGLKKSGKKKLNTNTWKTFLDLVEKSNFDNLANEKYIFMNDGATWTLEKKTSNKFKAHNTNWTSKEIRDICLFLLNLTNIKIKDDDKY